MKILISSLLGVLAFAGCASDEPSRETPMAADHDVATDPVTGTVVDTTTPWNTRWKGHWYYFGSEGSMRAFEANPSAYVPEENRREPREKRKLVPSDLQ